MSSSTFDDGPPNTPDVLLTHFHVLFSVHDKIVGETARNRAINFGLQDSSIRSLCWRHEWIAQITKQLSLFLFNSSQMLLSLIHCLTQLEKVAIVYVLPDMPVITILVDRSNQRNPIRVRSHDPSFSLVWSTHSFPVIRMWDELYPFWGKREFYTMMKDLEMTGQEHWIRSVHANSLIDLHPIVISLLGTHGCIEDEPNASSGGECTREPSLQNRRDIGV
ncbi:hypothetical protein BLNAU_23926 [Blattamonas nauphoetae]|uniref:Transposase n=1 Tax=Blattamonas nauphoetae TaxID=2049346 RepID=A0ABQ9WNU9_9EUKA|nr:hypothetical protein BLNAU_23926 [Blattamonas nauphoetae]